MEKQRKFYLVLPLLVIPFLTMAFWALGGGRHIDTAANIKGLDTDLPEAQFRDKDRSDKLAVYQAAQRDSTRDGVSPAFLAAIGMSKDSTASTGAEVNTEEQAQQIQRKLERLHQQISEPAAERSSPVSSDNDPGQVKRLQKLLRQGGRNSASEDPELKQLDRMLDKLQAIQNPGSAAPARTEREIAKPFRAIPAAVDGKQRVADGAAVQLKLTDTATIKGQLLKKGQLLFGSCQITNQRLLLTIKNIRVDEQIIPVNLVIYSEDGMQGIPAPEAELSGVTSSNADQALQSMQLMSMDQSIGAQAAAGGINAAKDLFSKKVKKIKVKLKDNYPVLLKINR